MVGNENIPPKGGRGEFGELPPYNPPGKWGKKEMCNLAANNDPTDT